MGYKYNDIAIKCPLFRRVVKTSADLKDYTDIFCKDRYTECPYYKIHSK